MFSIVLSEVLPDTALLISLNLLLGYKGEDDFKFLCLHRIKIFLFKPTWICGVSHKEYEIFWSGRHEIGSWLIRPGLNNCLHCPRRQSHNEAVTRSVHSKLTCQQQALVLGRRHSQQTNQKIAYWQKLQFVDKT